MQASCTYVGPPGPRQVYGSQETSSWSWFFSSTFIYHMGPGLKFRSQDYVVYLLPAELITDFDFLLQTCSFILGMISIVVK